MVQTKNAKKGKTTSSTASLKTAKKQEKKPLSNGYSKTEPKAGTEKSIDTPDSPKQEDIVPPEESLENSAKGNVEVIPKAEDMDSDEKKSPPKDISSSSKDSTVDNPKEKVSEDNFNEDAKPEETVPADNGKSRKRKQVKSTPGPSEEVPEKMAKIEEKTASSKEATRKRKQVSEVKPAITKSKVKKQDVDLEVPRLSSISGKVFVVGENGTGQLGLNDDINYAERPFQLDFLQYSIVDIAAGGMHSVCLTENGEVLTFGCNDEGALGRRTSSDEEERMPTKVDIVEKIVQVSAGDSHTAALAESGQVYLWGNFRCAAGQMGLRSDGQPCPTPVKVLTDKTIVKISSGADHLACLSNDGKVFTWGCAEQGQLGRINQRSIQEGGRVKGRAALLEPGVVPIKRQLPISDVWTESHATFLKAQGTGSIYACGLNNYNQLGVQNINSEQENQMVFFPKPIPSFNDKNWNQINGGQHHTIALDSDGLVHALGRQDYGRLGLGDSGDKSSPTVIPTLTKCSNISCGNCVSYAVTEEGELFSWGMGSSQLGHGESANENDITTPRLVKGKKEELQNSWQVLKVAGGGQHALFLACPRQGGSKDKKA